MVKCVKDQNGNHVVQKCIETVEPSCLQATHTSSDPSTCSRGGGTRRRGVRPPPILLGVVAVLYTAHYYRTLLKSKFFACFMYQVSLLCKCGFFSVTP